MTLRDWIAAFPVPPIATTATTATQQDAEGALSQVSQQSQPIEPPESQWPFREWEDLRPCLVCRNLSRSGRCLAAWRGDLRAARDYEPVMTAQPQRCYGYAPGPDDPDRRLGRDRWPWLEASQGPRRSEQ
jgi:hypothetical protein